MPKARMIATDIGQNYRVAQLPYEPHDAQKFFTWMLGKADKEGRLTGDPKLLAKIVAPYCDYSDKEVEEWLVLMESLKDDETGFGLIERYEVNEHKYIRIPGWAVWQPLSYRKHEAESRIPPPPETKKGKTQRRPAANIADDILDPRLASMVKAYEDLKGNPITGPDSELLKEVFDDYPEGWFEKGVEEAKKYDKRSLKYIIAILARWKEEGVDPLQSSDASESTDSSAGMKVEE